MEIHVQTAKLCCGGRKVEHNFAIAPGKLGTIKVEIHKLEREESKSPQFIAGNGRWTIRTTSG